MKIASLEGDPKHAAQIRNIVEDAGHTCRTFDRGHTLLHALDDDPFDLLILDRELPDICGLEVMACVRARLSRRLPVIVLTGKSEEDDIVEGLLAGADDYMIKPPRQAELLARMQSLYRRSKVMPPALTMLRVHDYLFDSQARTITYRGQPVDLTPKEYDLALLLFRNEGRIVGRTHIGAVVWGREMSALSRTIDTHVSRLRSKLGLRATNEFRLQPVYTHGYRLEALGKTSA